MVDRKLRLLDLTELEEGCVRRAASFGRVKVEPDVDDASDVPPFSVCSVEDILIASKSRKERSEKELLRTSG